MKQGVIKLNEYHSSQVRGDWNGFEFDWNEFLSKQKGSLTYG
jgi:hypothetical protein